MDRCYNVTIEYLGLKKQDKFPQSTICLGKDGAFLVMDREGRSVRFAAKDCKVEQIAAHVIILRGYTDTPRSITAYCVYANSVLIGSRPSNTGDANAEHQARAVAASPSIATLSDTVSACLAAIGERLAAKGPMYEPDAEWTALRACAVALEDAARLLTANAGSHRQKEG